MAQEETRKKKTGMARCLELASQHKGLVFISGILAAAAAVCSFLPYLSIYFIMRELIGVFPDMANANMSVVLRYGWMALGGIAGNVILYFCALMCSHLAAFGTLYELKLAFANHITEIPLGYHLTIGSGRMRKIMDENIESIEKFIAHQFPDFVASLVAPLALVILLLAIDWRYGIVSLFGIILAFVVQFLGFNGSAKEKMHHYQTAQEDMPEIKAFNQTADSFRRLSKSITDYTSFVLEYAMGWQNCMPGFTTIIHNIYLLLIPVGIFIGMGAEDYRTYSLTFIFYLVLAPAISGVLNKIMYISESFTQIDGNVERMEEVLSIPVLQNQDVGAREQGHSIEFDHVSFSYDTGTSVKALNDVSFIARQGEVTAIVGPSGGGKSTIANLISRFWDVTEGCIRIGGVDIRKIPQAELMRQVSFVFQDTFLFKQSILDNIRMGNPTASEAQVIEAAKAAQCHDFIEKLPDGYHTMIGASGIRLSGGERQRIAIARAIIKDAPIIVLDEATAFSDPENEYLIQKAFEKLIQNKTVIMIAHRLSTIRNADQILVMEHGQLIEQGTHDTMPITFLIIWAGRNLQIRMFDRQVGIKLEASSQIQEYLEGIKIIKSCGLSGERFSTLNRALLAMKKVAIQAELVSGVLVQSAALILQASLGIAIFVGTVLITGGQIELLPLLVLLMFSTQLYGPILAILSQLTSLFHLGTVTKRMRMLLTTPAMEGNEQDVHTYDIELKNVTFAYAKEDVIKDVSLKIPSGSITALVGPSGSGKSTISKLIARFWDVQKGSITIGGENIKNIEPEHLMKSISFVFQDVTLFNDTVYNNIRVGNMAATEEQVMAAAKAAYCDEFVMRLSDGYQTVLGENGSTLSGGERQRISIARALLKDAPIILLDEATASLDPENEVLIQRAIARLVEGKTVIMIAHRLRTVVDADQIFVLENGKLVERGTHDELIAHKGLYEKLYHIQQESLDWVV